MSFSTMLAKMVMKLPNSWLVKMSGGHFENVCVICKMYGGHFENVNSVP